VFSPEKFAGVSPRSLFLTPQITAGVCFYYEVFLKCAYSERPLALVPLLS
jgi:hypothetical protein